MTDSGLIDAPAAASFVVHGRPAPGGSKIICRTKAGRIFLRDAGGNGNTRWKAAVRRAARLLDRGEPMTGPLELWVIFVLARPAKHYRTGRFAAVLRDDAPDHHTGAPDTTKLLRSTEDALKGVLWVDDSQVVSQHATKRYAGPDEPTGARIAVKRIDP